MNTVDINLIENFSHNQLLIYVKSLHYENKLLEDKLNKIKLLSKIDEERLKVSPRMLPHNWFLFTNKLDEYSLKYTKYDNFFAITITFDPSKFDLKITTKDELINYFFNTLSEFIYEYAGGNVNPDISEIYGCIEEHLNGTPHFHFIMHSDKYNVEQIKDILKPQFTNNDKNEKAVVVKPVYNSKWLDYINKEEGYKKLYYRWRCSKDWIPPQGSNPEYISNKERTKLLKDRLDKINDITYITILRRDYNRLKALENPIKKL